MKTRLTFQFFDTEEAARDFCDRENRAHPATIPPAQDVDDLARLDMDLLRTVRAAIDASESQYAPAARERIDAVLAR